MSIARRTLLALSSNPWLRHHATNSAVIRRSVARFMPGETVDDALRAASDLRALGLTAILGHLGENLTEPAQADAVARHYVDVLDRVAGSGLDAHISVKPTQLGLDIDATRCVTHLHALVDYANARGQFVWIDMESSAYVDRTLDLFRGARRRSDRVGVALQAYLRRTAADIEGLLPLAPAIRLVKGAYLEAASIAFPEKSDVDENYYRLGVRLLTAAADRPSLVHIATHDARLATRLGAFAAVRGLPDSAYEFAMLYGIQQALQRRLIGEGRRVRVLIAYGDNWFPWYMRRLAERPANVWFVLKNLGG